MTFKLASLLRANIHQMRDLIKKGYWVPRIRDRPLTASELLREQSQWAFQMSKLTLKVPVILEENYSGSDEKGDGKGARGTGEKGDGKATSGSSHEVKLTTAKLPDVNIFDIMSAGKAAKANGKANGMDAKENGKANGEADKGNGNGNGKDNEDEDEDDGDFFDFDISSIFE